MNTIEFNDLWDRKVSVYWPRLAETKEAGHAHSERWYYRLQWYTLRDVEAAIGSIYDSHGSTTPKLTTLIGLLKDNNALRDANKPIAHNARPPGEAEVMEELKIKFEKCPHANPPFYFSERRGVYADIRTGEEVFPPFTESKPVRWIGRMAELMAQWRHEHARPKDGKRPLHADLLTVEV